MTPTNNLRSTCFPLASIAAVSRGHHSSTYQASSEVVVSLDGRNPSGSHSHHFNIVEPDVCSVLSCAVDSVHCAMLDPISSTWVSRSTCALPVWTSDQPAVLGLFDVACLSTDTLSHLPTGTVPDSRLVSTSDPSESVTHFPSAETTVSGDGDGLDVFDDDKPQEKVFPNVREVAAARGFFGQTRMNMALAGEGKSGAWWPMVVSAGITVMVVAILVVSVLIFASVKSSPRHKKDKYEQRHGPVTTN